MQERKESNRTLAFEREKNGNFKQRTVPSHKYTNTSCLLQNQQSGGGRLEGQNKPGKHGAPVGGGVIIKPDTKGGRRPDQIAIDVHGIREKPGQQQGNLKHKKVRTLRRRGPNRENQIVWAFLMMEKHSGSVRQKFVTMFWNVGSTPNKGRAPGCPVKSTRRLQGKQKGVDKTNGTCGGARQNRAG